jgi:transposase-like protein
MRLRGKTRGQKFEENLKKKSLHSTEVKNAAIADIRQGLSHTAAARKHGISNRSTLTKWFKIIRNGGLLNGYHGRPSDMSSEDKANFADIVNSNVEDKYAVKKRK